jgi:hypothetical protein
MWQILALTHDFTKTGGLGLYNELLHSILSLDAHTPPGQLAAMHIRVRGIGVSLFLRFVYWILELFC